jgi:hypothetical protein
MGPLRLKLTRRAEPPPPPALLSPPRMGLWPTRGDPADSGGETGGGFLDGGDEGNARGLVPRRLKDELLERLLLRPWSPSNDVLVLKLPPRAPEERSVEPQRWVVVTADVGSPKGLPVTGALRWSLSWPLPPAPLLLPNMDREEVAPNPSPPYTVWEGNEEAELLSSVRRKLLNKDSC